MRPSVRRRRCKRRQVLPLVCSRWRRLADAPPLVQSFRLQLAGERSAARLAAFRSWVQRSRADVRRLSVLTYMSDRVPAVSLGELLCALEACSGLEELRLTAELGHDLELGSRFAAAALPRLRLLHLRNTWGGLAVRRQAGAMAHLRELRLMGHPLRMGPAALLPPALTALHIGGFEDTHAAVPTQVCFSQPACLLASVRRAARCAATHATCMPLACPPPQVGALAQLERLRLSHFACMPDGFDVLSQLSQLTALELGGCDQ